MRAPAWENRLFGGAGIGAAPARALDLNAMSDAERDAFQAQVRAYLLEHPEVIMEAVAVLEQRQQAQQGEADKTMISDNKAAIFEDGADLYRARQVVSERLDAVELPPGIGRPTLGPTAMDSVSLPTSDPRC